MAFEWKESSNNIYYYYKLINGLICGQIHQLAHTQIWIAKVWFHPAEEHHLGLYISIEHAKVAVQKYYDMQERTFLENGNV